MNDKYQGHFSQSFLSLQLQLKTLFEGSGGTSSIELLDALGSLGAQEQELVIARFLAVIKKISTGEKRFLTEEDYTQKEIEENLYQEIISAMSSAAKVQNLGGRRLEVLDGGKRAQKSRNSRLSIASSTAPKKALLKPVLN